MHWSSAGRVWLWGYTASVVACYAVLARRTAVSDQALAEPAASSTESGPLISIVVPARDEERNICRCVESLLDQDYAHVEVVVVDDGSCDATPCLLDHLRRHHPRGDRLRVLRVEELPQGWAGKPHALHVGVAAAQGEWLLFTDADTEHAPSALRTALWHARQRQVDLLSIMTSQQLDDFWGRVLMPIAFMGISAMYPERLVNDPASDVAIANGQFLFIRRAVYDAVGGYDTPTMRGTVVDDRDLAAVVKHAGYRLKVADGRHLVRTHMYHGLREHWLGWGKNAYLGSRGGPAMFALMTVGLPAITVLPFALLAGGVARRRAAWTVAGAVQVAAALSLRTRLDRTLGIPWRYVWTHPLGGAVFTGILARAGLRKLTGRGVEWRGRTYRV